MVLQDGCNMAVADKSSPHIAIKQHNAKYERTSGITIAPTRSQNRRSSSTQQIPEKGEEKNPYVSYLATTLKVCTCYLLILHSCISFFFQGNGMAR